MAKVCQPTCQFFRCGTKALIYKFREPFKREGRWSRQPPLCSSDKEPCQGPKCSYAFCEKRVLLSNGLCGLEDRSMRRAALNIEEEVAKMELSIRQMKDRVSKKLLEEL